MAAGSSVVVTLVTLLGGVGAFPEDDPAGTTGRSVDRVTTAAGHVPATPSAPAPGVARRGPPGSALPPGSGSGRRVVFDISEQRVWLVRTGGSVARTYLVSGSVTDNLSPGRYAVYSRSRWAVGIDDSGVMQYFARFTRGRNAPIGFHSIPTQDGRPLQTRAELGTPRSHGCIRQAMPDAKRLWAFAPVGTRVVVTA